jgi:hypothetical protein
MHSAHRPATNTLCPAVAPDTVPCIALRDTSPALGGEPLTMSNTGPVTSEQILRWCTQKGLTVELISHPAIGQTNEEAAKVLQCPSTAC